MRFLILGATGTLGQATIKALLEKDSTSEIVCLSRDELKQFELRRALKDERLRFVLGDIRDKQSIRPHFKNIHTVFHFAALKRIPEMEAHPLESLKTNVLGTINAAECAVEAEVNNFVFSSTDKACKPINTYGASKFLSEQILFNMNQTSYTNFSVYRWGNVLGSRGSVVHGFKESLETRGAISLTDENMTRFWIKIEDAVKFILKTCEARGSEVRVPAMRAAPVLDVAMAIADQIGRPDFAIEKIGIRPGEKIHEDILPGFDSSNAPKFSQEALSDLIKGVL